VRPGRDVDSAWRSEVGSRKEEPGGKAHRFGGDWTERKLKVIEKYLHAYTTALKNRHFRTAYIDAFAGTGYRTRKDIDDMKSMLEPFAQDAARGLLDGSARNALKTVPRFDRYIFIERNQGRATELEHLRAEFPGTCQRFRDTGA
jgi:three-Cys-motif partner protein